MFDMGFHKRHLGQKAVFEECVPNYRINLLEAGSVEDLERFHTDLQPILGMLKYRGRKEELRDYIYQNRAYFGHVDKATYRAVGELLHSKKVWNQVAEAEKEGEIDMCQALEELYADGVEEGRREGLKEGVERGLKEGVEKGLREGVERGLKEGVEKGLKEGVERGILAVAQRLRESGFSAEEIKKYTGLEEQEIQRLGSR